MNNLSSLPKSLPEMVNSFDIEIEGSLTKTKYSGNFSCQIPNLRTQALIAKHKAMLNAGLEDILDIATQNLHHMVSYLKYTLVEVPKFWEESACGYDLFDINVVEDIYNKVLEFEEAWSVSIWGDPKEEEKKSKKKKK